ncbi:hypothetical protein D910_11761 [Dendroctonus ponderosae]|uniref:Uncharacterized protein n=1 Tax=Dendroctonus ponderosae TaxID=77166 RepID=U4UK78_DENPD|nr:hypothetical protein D910_11761 [Dendroctonus ponderosae]
MICNTCGSSRMGQQSHNTGRRIISRLSDVNWPARSCDLTPLDFFLWGYEKDRVYADNPQTLEQLKANIREVTTEILPVMCRKVIQNCLKRIEACRRSRGGHLTDIVFHVQWQGLIFVLN